MAVAALAQSDQPLESRKPRPPPDYSGRVQLHELPTTVAPPTSPEVKEDPTRIETRSTPSVFADRPKPLAAPSPGVPPGPDPVPFSMRDLFNNPLRQGDTRSGKTGWGWLADDIATNRARRAERRQSPQQDARSDEEELSNSVLDSQNRQDQITLAPRNTESDRRETAGPLLIESPHSDARETTATWLSVLPADRSQSAERATRDVNLAMPIDEADDRYLLRSPLESMSDTITAARESARPEPDRAEPARPLFDGSRLIKSEDYWPVEPPSAGLPRAGLPSSDLPLTGTPMWSAPSFAPLALAPADVSLSPTPSAPSAINTLQAPAMNALGGERERAAPRTLPW